MKNKSLHHPLLLRAVVSDSTLVAAYHWTGGADTLEAVFTESGVYTLRVTDVNGCVWEDRFEVQRCPTIVFFDTLRVQVKAEETAELCLRLINPSQETATTVEVAIEGSPAPYFGEAEALRSVEFAPGETRQCLSYLPPRVEEADSITLYTLRLQNAAGGNAAAIGEARQAELLIESGIRCRVQQDSAAVNCALTDTTSIQNGVPLISTLKKDDSFWAGDFEVKVTQSNGNGTFNGKGIITVPYLQQAQINVILKDVRVNEQCQMVAGEVKVEGVGAAILSEELANALNDLLGTLDSIDNVLGAVEDVFNTISTVINASSEVNSVLSTNWNVLHGADPIYNEYPDLPDSLRQQINEALLCYLSQPPSVCNAQLSQTIANLIAAINALFEADYAIRFRGFPQQHYGFDSLMYQPMVDDYNFLTVANQPYRVAWKSVEAGRSDSVLLLTPFAQLPDSLHFETNSRTPVPHHEHACGAGCADNGAAILPVTGGEHNKTYQIYPVQTRRDSLGNPERKYAGKLNVVSYNKKVTQVVIVPINGAGNLAAADAGAIQSQLNDIYRSAVASFTVELLPSLSLDWFESEAQNMLDSTNSAFYADYNAQMQRINQEINRLPGYDPEKYYLIVVQNAQGGIKGFMPRARNKGFIVATGHGSLSDLGRTMAHELGHGAFRLRHPWEQFSGLVPGQTDNLMDYASGTRLHHYQWHIVHNPPPLAGLLDGDEEGALVGDYAFNEDDIVSSDGTGPLPPITDCEYLKTKYNVFVKFSPAIMSAATVQYTANNVVTAITYQNKTYSVRYRVADVPGQPGVVDITKGPIFVDLTVPHITTRKKDREGREILVTTAAPGSWLNFEVQDYCGPEDVGVESFIYKTSNGQCETYTCPTVIINDYNVPLTAQDILDLENLLLGNNPTQTTDGFGNSITRHTLKAYIVVSSDSVSGSYLWAKNYQSTFGPEFKKIWLHKVGDNWTIPADFQWPANINTFFSYHSSYTKENFLSALLSAVDPQNQSSLFNLMANGVYELLDLVDTGLNYLKIPEYAWNCSDPKYKKVYAKIYGYLTEPINSLVYAIGDQLSANMGGDFANRWHAQEGQYQYKFAFVCGAWNSVVDVLKTVPTLLMTLTRPIEAFNELQAMMLNISKMERLHPNGTVECDGAWCLLYELKDQFDFINNTCTALHNSGGIVLGVLVAVFTGGAGSGAVVSTLTSSTAGRVILAAFRILNRIDEMTDIVGNSFKLVNKVTSGIRLRYLDLGPEYPLRDLGTINSSGTVSLFKKDGSILEISEADFNKDKFIYSNADGKIYYKHNGTNVELKARRIPGINWGSLVFNGVHLKIKNKLDQLFASGKVILGEPAGNRREVRYRQDPNSSTFDRIGELESNGEVGTFENIGNNHSPGDVLLEYTADGEMAIVQNGNAKTIKVCGCLAAGTTIATPSGPVSIEQLQAGDNILSPAQNGQMTIATITQIVESAAVKMMRIFSGGSYMDLTLGHPVFSPALGRKISVDSLRTGMSLLALSGLLLTVDSVAAVHYPTPVYDLQTDAGRGYFAGVEELLVSSNQCNLYLSGRNFNASQIETIEEAVSTSIEAFISDLEHSADLLEFFREASGEVLRGKAEAWRVAINTSLRTDVSWLSRIDEWLINGIEQAKVNKLLNEINQLSPLRNSLTGAPVTTTTLKQGFESGEINIRAWEKINDGIPSLQNNTVKYYHYLRRMSKYADEVDNGSVVKYYRVQTEHPGSQILSVNADGTMTFNNTSVALNISTDTRLHADYYAAEKLAQGYTPQIIEFEVPKSLDVDIKTSAIPQDGASSNAFNDDGLLPKIVDPNQPGDPFELTSLYHSLISLEYVVGSARVLQ